MPSVSDVREAPHLGARLERQVRAAYGSAVDVAESASFRRSDGRPLAVRAGFRDQVLGSRSAVTARAGWSDEEYDAAAQKRYKRGQRLLDELGRVAGPLAGIRALEVGCNIGLDSLIVGATGGARVTGIDIAPPTLARRDRTHPSWPVAERAWQALGQSASLDRALERAAVSYAVTDATRLAFDEGVFDLLWSRSVLEHVRPVDRALAEMSRVLRSGGLAYHEIDPFYWYRGCHKRGVVDIPWAHARMSPADFRRFVEATEGGEAADKRVHRLQTLNQLTCDEWRAAVSSSPFEVVEWREDVSQHAEQLLQEHPDVERDALDGLGRRDLVVSRIKIWLRNRA